MNKTQLFDCLISEEIKAHNEEMAIFHFMKFTPGFVLTGSRSFGTNNEESDYDFFIDSTNAPEGMISEMGQLGFNMIWGSSYNSDPSVLTVLEYEGSVKIHIQFIRPSWYQRKLEAQRRIEELFELLPDKMASLSKEQMKTLWTRLYSRSL